MILCKVVGLTAEEYSDIKSIIGIVRSGLYPA